MDLFEDEEEKNNRKNVKRISILRVNDTLALIPFSILYFCFRLVLMVIFVLNELECDRNYFLIKLILQRLSCFRWI